MTEYRIDYTITARGDASSDFEEIGFGSSGACGSVDAAAHLVESAVANGEWETTEGMPDPSEVRDG